MLVAGGRGNDKVGGRPKPEKVETNTLIFLSAMFARRMMDRRERLEHKGTE
jgi:hypothetical protein